MSLSFYSHGKLLISGEYAVLDGALSLALPTKKGQLLNVSPKKGDTLLWTSRDPDGHCWFETEFGKEELGGEDLDPVADDVRGRLLTILQAARKLNPEFPGGQIGLSVETRLEFPRNWGLGSSSTLINNLAQWAKVDGFELQRLSFGGSGYDIACAARSHPILFQRKNGPPTAQEVTFKPPFSGELYFVHLNRKQDSREGIAAYRRRADRPLKGFIEQVSGLTRRMLHSKNLREFEKYIDEHEKLLAGILGVPPIKESYFPDYSGSIKSLGAWGGDFILATVRPGTREYFAGKGHDTIIPFHEMVL